MGAGQLNQPAFIEDAADGSRQLVDSSGTPVGPNSFHTATLSKGYGGWGLRAVNFGHSFMDQEAVSGSSVIEGFSSVGTVAWANLLCGKPLQIVKEFGLGGYRLLDMIAQYASQVAPLEPDVLNVSIGHNDLKGLYPSGGSGQPFAQQSADARQTQLPYLIEKLRTWLRDDVSPKTRVYFLAEVPPGQDTTGAAATVSAQLAVRFQQFNRALWALCRERGNVFYVPTDRATTDPTSAVGRNVLGTFYDQVHPSCIGAYGRGKLLAAVYRRTLPIHADPLPASAADTHSNTALTTSSVPVSDGTTLTIPLSNGTASLKLIEVGDKIQLQPVGTTAADKALAGRYTVSTATTTAITCSCSVVATASANMKVANSRQLFINPLFLTTTGGNAGGFSNSGTITGTLPLGVDISNLPAGWTVNASTVAHTNSDGSAGYGNWLKLDITNASGAAGNFNLNLQCSQKSASPGTYDVYRKAHNGGTYQAGCEYKQVSAPSQYNGIDWNLYMRVADVATETAGSVFSARDMYRDPTRLTANTSAFGWPTEDFQGVLMTPEWTFDAGAGNFVELVQMRAIISMSGNAGPFSIYIGRAGLWAVDDPIQSGRISLQVG